jgi:hypothetical protein
MGVSRFSQLVQIAIGAVTVLMVAAPINAGNRRDAPKGDQIAASSWPDERQEAGTLSPDQVR